MPVQPIRPSGRQPRPPPQDGPARTRRRHASRVLDRSAKAVLERFGRSWPESGMAAFELLTLAKRTLTLARRSAVSDPKGTYTSYGEACDVLSILSGTVER